MNDSVTTEPKRRFEAALRGARLATPHPMKDIPSKQSQGGSTGGTHPTTRKSGRRGLIVGVPAKRSAAEMFDINTNKVVDALKPYRPTPIVSGGHWDWRFCRTFAWSEPNCGCDHCHSGSRNAYLWARKKRNFKA